MASYVESKPAPFLESKKDAAPKTRSRLPDGWNGLLVGLAEVEADVKFFFEKFGAAIGVYQVFSSVTTSGDAQADGSALKRCAKIGHTLSMGMVKRFGDAQ